MVRSSSPRAGSVTHGVGLAARQLDCVSAVGLKFCLSNKLPGGGNAGSPWHFIYIFLMARVTFHPVSAIYKSVLSALLGTKRLENRL